MKSKFQVSIAEGISGGTGPLRLWCLKAKTSSPAYKAYLWERCAGLGDGSVGKCACSVGMRTRVQIPNIYGREGGREKKAKKKIKAQLRMPVIQRRERWGEDE